MPMVRSYTEVTMSHDAREVRVSLPATVFGVVPWRPEGIAEEMRLLWLIEQVRERRLGSAKAAELAGVPLARFLPLLGVHGVPVFDLDPGELTAEFEGT
jgi:predicted HTH domain antitoxin